MPAPLLQTMQRIEEQLLVIRRYLELSPLRRPARPALSVGEATRGALTLARGRTMWRSILRQRRRAVRDIRP